MGINSAAPQPDTIRQVAAGTPVKHRRPAPVAPAPPAEEPPRYRTIMAVDIEGSTVRTDPAKAGLRRTLYHLLWQAFDQAGIDERHIDSLADRGDGVITLIHPLDEVPKTLLLHSFIPVLSALLAEHNARPAAVLPADRRFRVRVVIHAGETHRDDHGTYGEALDIACRLLDSTAAKAALRRTDAPLLLVVSEEIYHSVVRHGYAGIRAAAYAPLVRVKVAYRRHRGWVHAVHSPHPGEEPAPSPGRPRRGLARRLRRDTRRPRGFDAPAAGSRREAAARPEEPRRRLAGLHPSGTSRPVSG
ncbi:hypothetical protein [Actinomadura craniellae]|uniref:hypothetical protein n=1 Tax=Actinomadura craniellae TaxID=2231787 RepID=UPI0018F1A355|nr:hypothetical protein [Actinomadura craniellae]